jgi:hypothetical protein
MQHGPVWYCLVSLCHCDVCHVRVCRSVQRVSQYACLGRSARVLPVLLCLCRELILLCEAGCRKLYRAAGYSSAAFAGAALRPMLLGVSAI